MRTATVQRTTKETDIAITVNLDGTGDYSVSTGIGFLDHMVEQLSRHSLIDIAMQVKGDLHIDQHHTVEDSARSHSAKRWPRRSATSAESRVTARRMRRWTKRRRAACSIFRGARTASINPTFSQPRLGEMDTEMFPHWFHSFAQTAGITLHIEMLYGENNHHIAESMYKALARALRQAVEIDPRKGDAIPSTKGVL